MNPIITSLPGISPALGAPSQGGGVGDLPSFATLWPAYAEPGSQLGAPGDGQTGAVATLYGQRVEASPFSPDQQRQGDGPDTEEATDVDPLAAAQASQSQGALAGHRALPQPGASAKWQLYATQTWPGDGQQDGSAPLVSTLTAAIRPGPSGHNSQSLGQAVPQSAPTFAPEPVSFPAQKMNTAAVQGQAATASVGASLEDNLGAWRPLTGRAVTQVSATELAFPLAEGEKRTAEVPAPAFAQVSSGRGSQWGPVSLDVSAGTDSLGRQMLAPLKEQLRFSVDHGITKAEVRLDPPELGRIDLSVRHEGDRVTVQLTAANPAVREALALGAERLRSEMAQGLGGEVQVDVGQGAPQEKQQPEYPGRSAPMMAALDPAVEQPATERDLIDMLA